MNPLSPWTYSRRHQGHTALLLCLSTIVTIGTFLLVALTWAVFVEPPRLAAEVYSAFSMVTLYPTESDLESTVTAQIRAHPDVARVIPATLIRVDMPGLMTGQGFQLDLLGLMEEDVPVVLNMAAATLVEGQLPSPGTNALLLSVDVARMLGVKVGDTYEATSAEFYRGMDAPPKSTTFEVVGILRSDVELGIVSLEFLEDSPQHRDFPARLLVVAQDDRRAAVDAFLESEIQTNQTTVLTLERLNERIRTEALPGLVMLLPVVLLVATAFSLVIVVVNQIASARRWPEFGILHAVGRSKPWLIRRLTLETSTTASVGWVVGIGLSWLILYLLKVAFFAPRGHDLNYLPWLPVVFTLPVPMAITGVTFADIRRTLGRLDPVAIVERREQSQVVEPKRQRSAGRSFPNPLAPAIFYRRHRRRAVLLIGGMSTMIMAVVLFIFVLAVNADAQQPFRGYLSRVSLVQSPGIVQSLDASVVEVVKSHPAVERVIPFAPRISMLRVTIPPFGGVDSSPFGVYAQDMAYLVELYELELTEGHLPRPGSNDMVIPEVLAQNRHLVVGDVVGNPDFPAYPGAPALDWEFVISGVFAQPAAPDVGSGWGFVSLEFLEDDGSAPIPAVLPLIVVPKEGQKEILDDWLEWELAGSGASVVTYRQELSRSQQKARQDMLGMAVLEGAIALVAAIGLAILNYIFVSQRQSEFGVLHALGHSSRRLVGRVLSETVITVVAALGLVAMVTTVGMLLLHYAVFAPIGLTFDPLNLTPWLFTLPIPVAVLAATTGTTVWTLSKLDAVSIIERRE